MDMTHAALITGPLVMTLELFRLLAAGSMTAALLPPERLRPLGLPVLLSRLPRRPPRRRLAALRTAVPFERSLGNEAHLAALQQAPPPTGRGRLTAPATPPPLTNAGTR